MVWCTLVHRVDGLQYHWVCRACKQFLVACCSCRQDMSMSLKMFFIFRTLLSSLMTVNLNEWPSAPLGVFTSWSLSLQAGNSSFGFRYWNYNSNSGCLPVIRPNMDKHLNSVWCNRNQRRIRMTRTAAVLMKCLTILQLQDLREVEVELQVFAVYI